MEIIYKDVRNITAREKNWQILLILPFYLQGNSAALQKWMILVEKLERKLERKKKVQIFKGDSILLFWEYVPKSEFPTWLTTEKKWEQFFKSELYEYANPLLQELAEKLWFKNIPLKIRKTTSVWGTCSSDNHILLNETLVHLPTRLIQYVIVHESCHLVQKNHSDKFRDLVKKYCPNYKELRKELKNQRFIEEKEEDF